MEKTELWETAVAWLAHQQIPDFGGCDPQELSEAFYELFQSEDPDTIFEELRKDVWHASHGKVVIERATADEFDTRVGGEALYLRVSEPKHLIFCGMSGAPFRWSRSSGRLASPVGSAR